MQPKYIHNEVIHNADSPEQIIPVIIKMLHPRSVVDIGCGTGTFLKVFKQHQVHDVLGYDGKWVNKELLHANILPGEFKEIDLETRIEPAKRYDLAICLEVAEHLQENAADILIQNLVDFSDNVLFSAAIPGQGGQNHINEQYIEYWEKKFSVRGYFMHDILRPALWNNGRVDWWYRQNMVLFSKNRDIINNPGYQELVQQKIVNMAHPLLVKSLSYNLSKKSRILDDVYQGRLGLADYFRLMLKALVIKLGLKKVVKKTIGKMPGTDFNSNPYQ